VNELQELSSRLAFLGTALLEHLDQLLRHVHRAPEFDDCPRAEAVRVEVGQPDGNNLDLASGVASHGAQRHQGHAGFERQEVRPVMTATCKDVTRCWNTSNVV
jgi:hypothetical protein